MTDSRVFSVAEFTEFNSMTAADVMNTDPRSIRSDCPAREALAFLTHHGFGVAPVINNAGHPLGALSLSDLLTHERDRPREQLDRMVVSDAMTPAVFSVSPETSVRELIAHLVGLNVHHLFVVDREGVLVGVVSALDVLRRLNATAETD